MRQFVFSSFRKGISAVFNDLTEEDKDIVFHMILKARTMAKEHSIAQSGYKLVFNTERGGGQVIFHLHLHLLGGW